jgi:hypothetical protein
VSQLDLTVLPCYAPPPQHTHTPPPPTHPLHRRLDDTLSLDQCLLYADDDYDELELTAAAAPQHQALIPACRSRPAQPTPSEAKFLQAVQVYPPPTLADHHDAGSSAGGDSTAVCWPGMAREFLKLYRATVPRERAGFLAGTVAQLDRQLGPHLVQVSPHLHCASRNLSLGRNQPHIQLHPTSDGKPHVVFLTLRLLKRPCGWLDERTVQSAAVWSHVCVLLFHVWCCCIRCWV